MIYNREQYYSELDKDKPKIRKAQLAQRKREKDKTWKRIDHKTIILVK